MSVVLIGYRGSGKTTIGQKLADRLWQDLHDTDAMIVKAAGMTIREIFEKQGEGGFRELETAALKLALGKQEAVISVGGGAVLKDDNREMIRQSGHRVIYLKCDAQVLHERIHADAATAANRPALTSLGGTLAEVESLLAVREPIYRSVMTGEVDVTNLSVDEAVVYIVRLL